MISMRSSLVSLLCWVQLSAFAMSDMDYLPKSIQYDPNIPKPAEILGAPVGTWHVRHDQLVEYMKVLAQSSDRVSVVETGRTHENRPLLLLTITDSSNQSKIASMRSRHLNILSSGDTPTEDDPLVLWMGYSVHGDEPSGANASMLVAYYLAAAQGPEIDKLLKTNIVLLDPSVNPDGLSRFAQWANMHKGQNLVADPNHREHRQHWPSGRVNHYWFDLNRDWLLLTHPESRARIKQFQQWRPHVLTDFHEMNPNSTFFFQPGIESRKNPWTPDQNVTLTEALGDFHAAALDDTKQLYFTQEAFDDFYYGKGSTYPDAQGSIGILFEQASSRGHLQDTINGPLAFSATIQNQVTTSLSTFKGAVANKPALLKYQADFAKHTDQLLNDDDERGYLLTQGKDSGRFNQLKQILQQHQIEFFGLDKDAKIDDATYRSVDSIFVPLEQPQYRLIKSIFSTRKRFADNTFYDVSNWNLALAFNIQYSAVDKSDFRRLSVSKKYAEKPPVQLPRLQDGAYAYGFSWNDYYSPKLLQRLLEADVQVRIAGGAFSATTTSGNISFSSGSVVIPTALKQPADLLATLTRLSTELSIPIWSIESGLTKQGIDLGSGKMHAIEVPKVMIVGGLGTSQYEAGETWHYLDNHVGLPVSIIDLERLARVDLSGYSHMIWVDGRYKDVPESLSDKVKSWVQNGGILIGQQGAAKWFTEKEWLKAKFMQQSEIDGAFKGKNMTFSDKEGFEAKQRIAGAAFATSLDITHPLGFGYERTLLPVFKNSGAVMLMPEKAFVTVAHYTEKPLLAGYTSDELQDLIADSAAIVAHNMGQGKIIGFANNPNFRGYWYGTSRLLSNAIYMASFIDAQG
ncbi:M14 metallopeptidase family protein [Aliiglaciecola sp. LCG003]|uniref:M14 metallopeptidase family protein n=1 Tax=Aliiglaciecola sp. LCG003 TaxID=3053655 RepID=UPI00257337E0|nr:M14 metallopeptidase family protein [Aliiglaciecola sp. LCG003]WJG09330.1 M14 family metallopeptidase [Aliiglaciecola sp. LCG003]